MVEYDTKHGMPIQKVSTNKKTDGWFKESAKAAFNIALRELDLGRKSYNEKMELYNLYDGIIDESNMEEHFNTMNIPGAKFAPKFQHYPLMSPRIDLLIGEMLKRDFDYIIGVTNPDAISNKMTQRKQEFMSMFIELVQDEQANEEYMQQRLEEFAASDPRDLAEKQMDELVNYYSKQFDLRSMDEELFKDNLLVGEKIGCVEADSSTFDVRACDTLMTLTARDGGSKHISDAEIIAEVMFYPVGKIIEEFFEDLSSTDIDKLIGKKDSNGSIAYDGGNGDTNTFPTLVYENMADLNYFTRGNSNVHRVVDEDGNIRVVKIKWKGFRKIGRVKYYVNGEEMYRLVSEDYKSDKSRGEELEVKWITEWHESWLIKDDIWLRMKISDMQYRSFLNPYESKSGYFGDYNITANGTARSLMDRARSLSYFYDMTFARLEDLLSKNIGKVIELDTAKIPEGMDTKLWLYYLKSHNIAIVNSFKSGDKGIAQGKLAGSYNTTGRGIDMELGSSISSYIGILAMIENLISKITGITDQRMGQISSSELVGNVERSTIQSNHITEQYFNSLDDTRIEYTELLMDAARFIHKDDKSTLQYAKDDMQLVSFEVDGELISHVDFAIFASDSTKDTNFANILRNAIQQQVMNSQGDPLLLLAAHSTNSMAKLKEILNTIKSDAKRTQKEMTEHATEVEKNAKLEVLQYERENMNIEHQNNIELEELKQSVKREQVQNDRDNDGVADNIQMKVAELNNSTKLKEIESDEKIAMAKIEADKKKATSSSK